MSDRNAEVVEVLRSIIEGLMRLLGLLQREPEPPKPEPPAPTPVPVPTPVPQPQPAPQPPVDPAPTPFGCAKPTALKLGFRGQHALARGYRIEFDASPLVDGVKAPESCGEFYFNTYGEPQAFQSGPGFAADPVERASNTGFGCILRIATNYEGDWEGDRYKLAGKYSVGVSYPWLSTWRCQDFTIDEQGQAHGAGTNAQSYDRPK